MTGISLQEKIVHQSGKLTLRRQNNPTKSPRKDRIHRQIAEFSVYFKIMPRCAV
jgi:hypothetical protein